jgi:hypothetical protein
VTPRRALALLVLAACTAPVAPPPPAVENVTIASGCDEVGPLTFYPPTGFSVAVTPKIMTAADVWTPHVRVPITFSERGHLRVLNYRPSYPGLAGQHPGGLDIILIDPAVDDALKPAVARHEYGHAFGMDHVAVPGSIMCGVPERPDAPPAPPDLDCGPSIPSEPSLADLAELVRIGARDP